MSGAAKPDYLDTFERTFPIRILGAAFEVPDNNTVLRILQHLELERGAFELSYKDFCWNADCQNCKFRFLDPASGQECDALACSTRAVEGMSVVRLPWPVRSLSATPDPTR